MENEIRQAAKENIPQIADLLIDHIDYVYARIFPGTDLEKRKRLIASLLMLSDANNFLEYRRFYCFFGDNGQLIGICGLFSTEKTSFSGRIRFIFKVISVFFRTLSLFQFSRFLLSLYRNRGLFTSDVDNSGYITYIIVSPEHQNRGVGSRLLAFTLENFRQKGYCEISLVVRSNNHSAIAFFTAHGFIEIKRKPDSFKAQGEKVVMARSL